MSNATVKNLEGPYKIGSVTEGRGTNDKGDEGRRKSAYISFGGLAVEYYAPKNRFIFGRPEAGYGERIEVADADVPDVIRFMLDRWEPWGDEIKKDA